MKKKRLRLLFINAPLLILAVVCFIVSSGYSGKLTSQLAAQRWTGESDIRFNQLSCYLSDTDELGLDDIYEFRQKLDSKLVESSIEAPENGSLYVDAWSVSGKAKAVGDHGSGDAYITAVGGDYFFFHPLRLLSGGYISDDDLMEDRVVLDKELAWRLFGGVDLEGMTMEIDGKPYVIAGVVERESDKASKAAYTYGEGLFMSFRAYAAMSEDNAKSLKCYEIVMPQPVDGFAESFLKESFKIGSGEVVNNTTRFENGQLTKIMKSFGSRSMHLNSVVYPYWENAARYNEDWAAMYLFLAIIFAVIPVVTAFVILMILLIRGKDYLEDAVPEWTSEMIDRGRRKRYNARTRGGAHAKKPAEKPKKAKRARKKSAGPESPAPAEPSGEKQPWETISGNIESSIENDDIHTGI